MVKKSGRYIDLQCHEEKCKKETYEVRISFTRKNFTCPKCGSENVSEINKFKKSKTISAGDLK